MCLGVHVYAAIRCWGARPGTEAASRAVKRLEAETCKRPHGVGRNPGSRSLQSLFTLEGATGQELFSGDRASD